MSKSVHTTAACDNRPVGVFDSGLGGLTVVAALREMLPGEDIIYLGDTARVPYGDKSVESIRQFVGQDVDFLLKHGVKMVVFACNTASAVAMDHIRRRLPEAHLLGVIEAGIQAVLEAGVRRVTVIGTRATINSDSYRRGIHAVDPGIIVDSIPCPLLVPLAEEGFIDSPLTGQALDFYLNEVRNDPPEALLLGCTHYPLFRPALERYFDGRVRIIDSAAACAVAVRDYLAAHGMAASCGKKSQVRFFVTDMHSEFHRHATRFLGASPERVSRVSLEGE